MITYLATNTTNGKFYIGSTNNLDRRKREHARSKQNHPFHNSLRKNPEAFEWEYWEDDSNEPVLEQALLDMWFGKECCYNLCGEAGRPPSWEGKQHKDSTKSLIQGAQVRSWEGNEDRRRHAAEVAASRKWTQESRDKIGDTNSQKWGNEWKVQGPDGTVHTITNLRRFCKEHNLNRSCLMDLVKQRNGQKSHRGFTLVNPEGKTKIRET